MRFFAVAVLECVAIYLALRTEQSRSQSELIQAQAMALQAQQAESEYWRGVSQYQREFLQIEHLVAEADSSSEGDDDAT